MYSLTELTENELTEFHGELTRKQCEYESGRRRCPPDYARLVGKYVRRHREAERSLPLDACVKNAEKMGLSYGQYMGLSKSPIVHFPEWCKKGGE